MKKKKLTKIRWGASPWFLSGAAAIIIFLFLFLTLDRIEKQEAHTRQLLLAQGETLIRSFEAGIRTGAGMNWGAFELQKLLIEMAQQPDIDHIIVVDGQGTILADSDPAMAGETYGLDLDLSGLSLLKKPQWRLVSRTDRAETFEVFRRFLPLAAEAPNQDSLPASGKAHGNLNLFGAELTIFVGLNMAPIKALREEERKGTLATAAILLAVGIFGVLSLFFAQAYRSTRVSLTNVQALSDNIIRHMPIGLLAVDAQGKLSAYNQEAQRILPLPLADLWQKEVLPRLPPALGTLLAEVKAGSPKTASDLTLPIAQGSIPLEVVAAAIKDDGGSEVGRLLLLRDVSELKHLREEVARSQRLASLGNLAAGLAHEIRNPLSSLKGFATYFRDRLEDRPEDRRSAEIMISEVDRLNRVITQLLDLSRPVKPEAQNLELGSLIREVIDLTTHKARESGVEIIFSEAAPRVEITGDISQLKQVLFNLFINAIEAMEQGGLVSVRLEQLPGGGGSIVIKDQGVGISAAQLPHIFDPYFTTKPAGTGLGLAIVHKIIAAHGGEIKVESQPGKGSTFSIFLPRPKAAEHNLGVLAT